MERNNSVYRGHLPAYSSDWLALVGQNGAVPSMAIRVIGTVGLNVTLEFKSAEALKEALNKGHRKPIRLRPGISCRKPGVLFLSAKW